MDEALHRLEQRTNRAYWSDGLLDLLTGVALVIIGASWVGDWAVFGGMVPALLVPLWKPLRKRFTEPRLGFVELAEARLARQQRFLRMAVVAGVLAFLIGIGAYVGFQFRPDLVSLFVPCMPGVMLGLAAIATAEALELPRFFVYGGVLVLGGLVVGILGGPINPGWAMLAGGVAMVIGGAILAVKLVNQHTPQPDESEAPHE